MTKLTATLKDFSLVRDLLGQETEFRFQLGYCDDFDGVLEEFKANILPAERGFTHKRWFVKATKHNYYALSALFDNFTEEYEQAKSGLFR